MELESKRDLLRHLVATIIFRGRLAVSGAPDEFENFGIGQGTRTAGQILAHIGDLMEGTLHMMQGEMVYLDTQHASWEADVVRFLSAAGNLELFFASDAPLAQPLENLVQGPIADALTHIGQIVMLRRAAGSPIEETAYFTADIYTGR